ncbi:MAG TPA: pyridoxamine kinase [Candidatus Cloacimonadota bacterium]|nr:pyridoxamine kinase [Candidatus Cloacimonadota bacterium]
MRKRILAIHDLSGFGNGSLMSIIPIMYRYGIQVTALPSALLSANTCYEDYAWLDTSSFLDQSIAHYTGLNRRFSAIYSGFLGSPQQADLLCNAIGDLATEDTLVVIDPVMADDGKLYGCYCEDMVEAMRKLVAKADLITPNYTEACFLAGWEYRMDRNEEDLQRLCADLSALGPKSLIITSVPDTSAEGSRVLYHTPKQGSKSFPCSYIPVFYPGTGDIFCALILALHLNGYSIEAAIPKVTAFIHRAIAYSMQSGEDHREGVLLESLLFQDDLR